MTDPHPHPTTSRRAAALTAAALLVLAAACGLQQSSSASLGSTGGTLQLESGLTLQVPPQALTRDQVVSLRQLTVERDTDLVEVDPPDAPLSSPAVLSWPDDGTRSVTSASGELLTVHRQCGRAHVHLHHFGHFRCHRGGADGGMPAADAGWREGEGHGGDDGHGGEGHGGGGHDGEGDGDDGHSLDGGHHDGDGEHGDDGEHDDDDDDDEHLDGGCPVMTPDAGTSPGADDGGVN